jgi:hypothetical protein
MTRERKLKLIWPSRSPEARINQEVRMALAPGRATNAFCQRHALELVRSVITGIQPPGYVDPPNRKHYLALARYFISQKFRPKLP